MTAPIPARPVLSEACRQSIAELVADWPPLTDKTRAVIAQAFRTGRRLGRVQRQEAS